MRNFTIFDGFGSFYPEFAAETGGWLKAGKVHYSGETVDGLETTPAAFIVMLNGERFRQVRDSRQSLKINSKNKTI